MTVLRIAFQSWRNRKLSVALAIVSIALGSALFLGVEKIRSGVRTSFSQTISGTDLIVGTRSSSLNVLLNTVFHVGISENMIRYETFEKFQKHPAVKWVVPLSFGDSYHGNRVIGTNRDFFRYYEFRKGKKPAFSQGHEFEGLYDAVIGSSVAQQMQLKPGDSIILAHGISDRALLRHDDSPFSVVGVLAKTNTPVDRSVLVSLEAIEAIHKNWQSGAFVSGGKKSAKESAENYSVEKVSAFLLGAKSRLDVLGLQREIADYKKEPLSVAIPGMALAQLWQTLGSAEQALLGVSLLTALVSLLSMLIAVLSSLQHRRREMAILRSLGAGPVKLFWLFTIESGVLASLGLVTGFALTYGLLFLFQGVLESSTGVYIAVTAPGKSELIYAGVLLSISALLGFLPGAMAYRMTLRDGLAMRT